jgi:hypothetical protein
MADERCDVLCLDLPKAERLRQGRLSAAAAEVVRARAHALADPTRLTIAASLREGGELCGSAAVSKVRRSVSRPSLTCARGFRAAA